MPLLWLGGFYVLAYPIGIHDWGGVPRAAQKRRSD